ncbi:RteC domain-containing protein [Chryseobacterium sp. POL2]|uniref:RteC domain-containing protein n=1 Tax=Chryseobacterium sp. POL2 TaxID=2713414 RepID=UPI001E424351|nr:RteC domain-containing protein [Chryseobacterium sp. POL2]
MDSHLLLQKTEELWEELLRKNQHLQRQQSNELLCAQYQLMEVDACIQLLKSWVLKHEFADWSSEIIFFKKWKAKFCGHFIFLSKKIECLVSFPVNSPRITKRLIEHQLEQMNLFCCEHRDFISYYRRGASHNDKRYFLRFRFDLNEKIPNDYHSYDNRFCTAYDHLLAQVFANESFEVFLQQKLDRLKNRSAEDQYSESPLTALQWTGSKSALIELLFALYHSRSINAGSIELAEFIRVFEKLFNTGLGNYHKTIGELRYRKVDRTKFLHHLEEVLCLYMDGFDEAVGC